jgi:hypothetical protein
MRRARLAARRRRTTEPATASASVPDAQVTVEYLRLIYRNNLDWYAVSETKAQILMAVHGAFVSVVFGTLLGVAGDLSAVSVSGLGPETWAFLGLSVFSAVGAVVSATLCMWSRHGRTTKRRFANLGVNPGDPATYGPEVLWYFGHIARLEGEAVVERLGRVGTGDEIRSLSYNVVELSARVLRKHRWVNAGWAFTGLALVALSAAAVSLFLRVVLQ